MLARLLCELMCQDLHHRVKTRNLVRYRHLVTATRFRVHAMQHLDRHDHRHNSTRRDGLSDRASVIDPSSWPIREMPRQMKSQPVPMLRHPYSLQRSQLDQVHDWLAVLHKNHTTLGLYEKSVFQVSSGI